MAHPFGGGPSERSTPRSFGGQTQGSARKRDSRRALWRRAPAFRKSAGATASRQVQFETLEPRFLLSADLLPFTVDMAAPDTGNDLTLRLDALTNKLQFLDNRLGAAAAVIAEQALDQTASVVVRGTDADDRLTIDFTNPFSLSGGIAFSGGQGFDRLIIENGVFESVSYVAGANGAGAVDHDNGLTQSSIAHSAVEDLLRLTQPRLLHPPTGVEHPERI